MVIQIKPIILTLIFLVMLVFVPAVFAEDFARGYKSDDPIVPGTVVGIDKEDDSKVVPINSDRNKDMFGVIIEADISAITLKNNQENVLVATNGKQEVFVSDINGPVTSGDYVAISALTGVVMKSDVTQEFIFGRAVQTFDTSNPHNVITQETVDDGKNGSIKTSIGKILVEIKVEENPEGVRKNKAPKFLVGLGESIAGKTVSDLRIYASLVILFVTTAISASLLYGAIKNSIISIGRNPLSKQSVFRGLGTVLMISVFIFISGLIGVYFILTV